MSILSDLRQRKLVQWALAYLAGAWVLLQVVGLIGQQFDWPPALLRGITVAAGVGFLIALVLAWYHGESGAQRVTGTELLVLALLLTIGGALLWRFAPGRPATVVAPAPATAVPDNSIAVLPFVNMSGDADNEYFSDGVSEEILNVLAGAPELQVAARTSSFSFKGKATEVPDIARELHVRMVLEGSVRKQGEQVRVTAQLVDAATGFHVWSQTYDRKLQDIFAIQDEIARSISDELKVKLGDAHARENATGGTRNLQAYELYLRGMSLWNARGEKELLDSLSQFEKAAVLDPNFAQAYAGQALVYTVIGEYSSRISFSEAQSRSSDLAELALGLDPGLPEPYAVIANNAANQHRWATADALFRRAIALRPSFATAYFWRGATLLVKGDLAAGLSLIERASKLDPRSAPIGDNLALALLMLGRYDEARAVCQRVFEFAPDYAYCLDDSSLAALLSGDLASAQAMLERLAVAINPSAAGEGKRVVDALQGRADRHALAVWLASQPRYSRNDPASGNVLNPISTSLLLVLLGEHDLALDFLERTAGDAGTDANFSVLPPVMDALRCQPRFRAVIERIKTTDPRAATVCAGKL